MLLREVLPKSALNETHNSESYYKFLDVHVLKIHEGPNLNIFKVKNITRYFEIEGGYFIGVNLYVHGSCIYYSFPVKKKPIFPPGSKSSISFW